MTLRAALLVALVGLAGCFDSLVSGECADGYVAHGGRCQLAGGDDDGGVGGDDAAGDDAAEVPGDGGSVGDARPAVDAGVCGDGELWCGACVDPGANPDHCGACGVTCASGICGAGACVGGVPGHVVLIGHDYRQYRSAAARVLANAAALSGGAGLRIEPWVGDAPVPVIQGVQQALTSGLDGLARPWEMMTPAVGPPGGRDDADVFLILPQGLSAADGFALGQSWAPRLASFVAAGGVVIALDGAGTGAVDVLRGSGLLDVARGAAISGAHLTVSAPGDALAVGVPTPYLADTSSTTFSVAGGGAVVVVTAPGGQAVVVHGGG